MTALHDRAKSKICRLYK